MAETSKSTVAGILDIFAVFGFFPVGIAAAGLTILEESEFRAVAED